MKEYLFITGTSQALSVAEIVSVLKRENILFDIVSIARMQAIIKIAADEKTLISLHGYMGGTIRIATIIKSSHRNTLAQDIADTLGYDKKVRFGISSLIHTAGNQVNALAADVKKALKPTTARHIPCGPDPMLNAVSVIKNNLATTHWEILITKGSASDNILIARTIAIQNIHAYSLRDYRKPGRDAKRGMLPPKLAQIMINLIPKKPKHIHDAFCGSGTVLGEAFLMNIPCSGSDIDPTALELTQKNLAYLAHKYNKDPTHIPLSVQNSLQLNTAALPTGTWIISEVDLGHPKHQIDPDKLRKEIMQLSEKYRQFLRHIGKSEGTIAGLVLALPFFQDKKDRYFLPIIDDIAKFGYTIINPLQSVHSMSQLNENSFHPERSSFTYSREGQHTGREIIILQL